MKRILLIAMAAVAAAGSAQAQTVVPGMAFTFVTDFDYPTYGYIIPGVATNGNFGNAEFELGFAEIDLAGLGYASTAALSFRYASGAIETYSSTGISFRPPTGIASFAAYVGDNVASRNDYASVSVGSIGSLDLASTSPGIGLTFDVTSLYNVAIGRGDPAFGVRVGIAGNYFGSAPANEFVTFDRFALAVTPVPEPSTYALMVAALGAFAAVRRRRAPPTTDDRDTA